MAARRMRSGAPRFSLGLAADSPSIPHTIRICEKNECRVASRRVRYRYIEEPQPVKAVTQYAPPVAANTVFCYSCPHYQLMRLPSTVTSRVD